MEKKPLWQFPWLYKESFIFVAGVVAVGFLLQVEVGVFNFALLAYPVNVIVAAALALFLAGSIFIRSTPVIVWLSGIPFANALLFAFLVLGIIMGLTPQSDSWEFGNIFSTVGFTRMTASWPFVLVYFLLLVSLGLVTIRRMLNRPSSIMFCLNHFGLWFLLLAAGLGYADMQRYIMTVPLGQVEVRGYNANNVLEPLPLAIQLNEFSMEVFPPKLAIIDTQNGQPQPVERPDLFQIGSGTDEAEIAGWRVKVESFIPKAARSENNTFVAWPMLGSVPAAQVSAYHISSGEERHGWISSGNSSQAFMALELGNDLALVMALPEPKRFVSDVTVMTPDDQSIKALIAVNEPLIIGHWHIYQYAYDSEARELSPYSNFELIYDPWLYPIYAGFGLMALGAAGMIWTGRKKDKNK